MAVQCFSNPLERDDLCLDAGRIAQRVHAEDGNDQDEQRELSVVVAISGVRRQF